MISVTMPKNGNAMMYTSGWPKNQNRCCHSRTPPLAGSKMCAPRWRSAASPNSAAVSSGKATSTMIAGDQDVPGEDRHPEHRHAGRAHAHHGGDHVDRAQDGAQATDDQTQDPQITARARGVDRIGQRGVGGPAEVGGPPGAMKPASAISRAEQKEPERQRIQPRERDIGGADLQRQHQVGEPEHDRGGVEQQHHRAVHGEQLVVLLVGQKLQPGRGQFGADQQRHQPADEEEREARDDST